MIQRGGEGKRASIGVLGFREDIARMVNGFLF
jgi:hypothetical protein